MAEVYLAEESPLAGIRRRVVVKRLLADKRREEEFVTMFLDEARLMSRLSHPHVVQVLGAGMHDGSPYLAVEHVDGPSYRDVLAAASYTETAAVREPEALRIALTLAETLAYVHSAHDEDGRPMRIVHRDLTPANVIISYEGIVKLIDFGIAQGENRVYQTSTGVLKGTCGYMAPEQLVEQSVVDHRVDVFAFGVMLYEACVGRHPFNATHVVELYDLVLETRFDPPRKVRPALSPTLEWIICACMARDANDRPESMYRVAEMLRDEMSVAGTLSLAWELGEWVRSLCPPEPEHGGPAVQLPDAGSSDTAARWVTQVDPGRKE